MSHRSASNVRWGSDYSDRALSLCVCVCVMCSVKTQTKLRVSLLKLSLATILENKTEPKAETVEGS